MAAMTLSQAAELIARYGPEGSAPYYAAQIRRFVQRGVVLPIGHRGYGRTATQLIDERGLVIARLMSELVQRGFGIEDVFRASRLINNVGPHESPARLKGFGDALRAIRAGERVFFAVRFEASGDLSGGFRPEAALPELFTYPVAWSALVVLDATHLVRPLLREADAVGDGPGSEGADADEAEARLPPPPKKRPAARGAGSSVRLQGEFHAL